VIRQAFKRLWHDKRGNALLIAGAAMPLVIGSAGLASDTIQWALWKRQIQRAADSAALAGVYHRIQNDGSTSAVGTAVDYDLARHNFAKPALLAPATITFPAGTNWGYPVRVALSIQQRLNFSSFFMSTPPVITATGTAATSPTGVYCVVSLVDTSTTGIKSTGNGNLNLGCGMIT
jgi:Flp pilus assembly protein TadG